MAKNIKCALIPASSFGALAVYIVRNQKTEDLQTISQGIIDTLSRVEGPNLKDSFEEGQDMVDYFRNIVKFVKVQGTNIIAPAFSDTNQFVFEESLVTKLQSKFEKEIEVPVDLEEEVIEVKPEASVDEESSNGEENPGAVHMSTVLDEIAKKRKLEKGEIAYHKLINLYFKGKEALAADFSAYFKRKFYSEWINTDAKANGKPIKGHNKDLNKVLLNLKEQLESNSLIKNEQLKAITEEELLNSPALIVKYYDTIINSELSSLVKTFLPGIDLSADGKFLKAVRGESTVRTGFATNEDLLGGLNQTTDALNLHLENTSRLIENEDGTFSIDENKPFLTRADIVNVAGLIGSIDNDQDFEENFYDLIQTTNDKDTKNILYSIYNNFFNGTSYKLGNQNKISLSRLGALKDIINDAKRFMTSLNNKAFLGTRNGQILLSTDYNQSLRKVLTNDYEKTITDSKSKKALSSTITDKISIDSSLEEGNVQLNIKTGTKLHSVILKAGNNYRNGVPVQVVSTSVKTDKDKRDVLKALGLPTSFTSTKFLNYYSDNISSFASNNDIGINNLIGNLAFIVALNDKDLKQAFSDNGFNPIPSSIENKEPGRLLYSPFDILHAFLNPIAAYDEKLSGNSEAKNAQNVNGDWVSTVGIASTMDKFNSRLNQERVKGSESVHNNNLLINSSSSYSLDYFVSKDGIIEGDNKKGNQSFTKKEHFKTAVVDYYLKVLNKTNFKQAAFQLGTMSDRKDPKMGLFSGTFGDVKDLKVISKGQFKGMTRGFEKIYRYENGYHKNLTTTITSIWLEQLGTWLQNGNIILEKGSELESLYNNIKDINSLQAFLKEANIPTDLAKESTLLESQLMYNPNAEFAVVKDLIIEMNKIWSNPSLSDEFLKSEYNNFLSEITDLEEGFILEDMNYADKAIMTNHFQSGLGRNEKNAFARMLKLYFQDHMLMSRNALNLTGGHIYQYKGEIEENSKKEQSLRNKLIKKGQSEEKINQEIIKSRISNALEKATIDQSKRLAMVTSGYQRPRTITSDVSGTELGASSKTVLVSDPEAFVELLGDLKHNTKQDIYDAAMLVHPFYALKLNSSFGNENSGFASLGGAIKDLSLDYNERTSSVRGQKKASFSIFNNEILKKSPALQRLFKKMNESITFVEPLMGANNMHELWVEFGSYENDSAWEEILEIIGTTKDSNEEYSFRDAYIEKVGFATGEKMGNRGFNTDSIWKDTTTPLIYTEFSNKYHGVILNADHDTDTSGDTSSKSLMTQLISAVNFGGYSLNEANQINDTLNSLSNIGIYKIQKEIKSIARKQILDAYTKSKLDLTPEGYDQLKTLLDKNFLSEEEQLIFDKFLTETGILTLDYSGTAAKEYVRSITEKAIVSRDSIQLTDLVVPEVNALNSMQLSSVVHSSIQAVLNTETNKFKFKGQEMVVAPGAGFIKLYNVPGTDLRVTREEYIKHVNLESTRISSQEELDLIFDSEYLEVGGEEMLAVKVKNLVAKGELNLNAPGVEITGIILPEENSEELKWTNYINKETSESINKSPEYIALLENSRELEIAKKEGNKELHYELENKREQLNIDLENILVTGDWETKAAEIAMPSMHMASFDLYQDEEANMGKGEEGAEALEINGSYVSLSDIKGVEQSGGEFYLLNGEIVGEGVKGSVKVYQSEINAMYSFFTRRIKNNPKKYKLDQFRQFDSLTLSEAKSRLNGLFNKLNSVSGFEINNIEYRIQGFNDVISKYNIEGISEDVELTPEDLDIINISLEEAKNSYISGLAEIKTASFPSSLEAFMARVPGQSKQSGAPARIKTFVFSTRNSLYAPVEMLTVTGADHDIDKAHILVYSIDNNGNFYSYKEYLDENGRINYKNFDKLLTKKLIEKGEQLERAGITGKDAQEKLDSFTKKEILKFQEGSKNFILSKILEVYGDPKNAIEASTPMSMEKLKSAIEDEWLVDVTEEGDTVVNKGRISPYSPASIFALERINSIGKDGIGIFATGLKTYAAIHNSVLNDEERVGIYSSEYNRLGIKKDGKPDLEVQGIITEYLPEFKNDFNAIAVYDSEGKPVISREISGIYKSEKSTKKYFQDAWRDLSELLSAATDNAKELILAKIGADSATSGVIGSAIIAGIPMEPVLNLFKTKEVKALVRKFERENDLVANSRNTFKSFSAVIQEDWSKRVNSLIDEIRTNKNNVGKLKKESAKEIITSDLIKENLNGSISNLTISTDTNLKINQNLNITVENSLNGADYFDKAKELGLDLTRITDKEVIATMKAMEGASTIILKDNDDIKSAIVKSYAKINNIEVISTKTGVLPLMSLKAGKLAVVGSLSSTKQNSRADENINNIIDNNKLAIENSNEYDKNAEAEFINRASNLSNAEQKLESSIRAYLSDGARQLLTFSKLGDENRAISSFLSINGGTPNGRFDVYNYYNKIAKAINNKEFPFSYSQAKEFLTAVVEDDEATIQNYINSYEGVKVGINPFFVMANSPWYSGLLKGMQFGSKLDSNSTFSGEAVERYIESFHSSNPRDKKAYNEINSVIYGLTIDSYLNKSNKTAKINGITYNLKSKEDRENFIKALPDFKDKLVNDPKLEDNLFVQRLRLDFAKDGLNDIAYLRSDDLNTLSPDARSVRQLHLSKLKNMGGKYEDIYNALYLYSLITKKGARGADDFASLFLYEETPIFREYLDHLEEIESNPTFFDSLNNLSIQTKELLASQSISVISTKPGNLSFSGDEDMDVDMESDADFSHKKNGFKNDGLQVMPRIPESGPRYLTFKSAETGQLYAFKDGEYLPVTLASPMKAIPYSLLTIENVSDVLAGSGFKFGHEAVIDDSGTVGQVLKFKDGKYVVELENGNIKEFVKEDLQRLNPEMLFSNSNFGPLLDTDKLKMAEKESLTTKSYSYTVNNKLKGNDIERLKRGPLYEASFINEQNSKDFYSIGEVVKKQLIKGTPVKVVYRGKHGLENKDIVSNLVFNKTSISLENKKINEVHIFEYVLERELTDSYPNLGKNVSLVSLKRIEDNKTNHFVTERSINLKPGEEKIYSYKGNLYKVYNSGLVKDLYKNTAENKKSLAARLNISTKDVTYKRLNDYFAEDSAASLYSVMPYSAKENSKNSYLEYNLMQGEEFEVNLKGNNVTLRETGANPSASSLLMDMGVENITYANDIDKEYLNNIIPIINEDAIKAELSKMDESTYVNISSINNPEVSTIFMVSSFQNLAKKINADVKVTDKDSIKFIKDLLAYISVDTLSVDEAELIRLALKDGFKDKTLKDNLLNILTDLETDLKDKTPNILNQSLIEAKGYQKAKLTNEILKLKDTLSKEIELNKELRFISTGINFGPMQAAKRSNKDFYIYNPTIKSWFKYNNSTGNFDPTKIPVLSGKDLFIGSSLSNKNKTVIDSVLKATSKFKSLQDKPAVIPFKSTGLIVSGSEVNESINEVKSTGLEAINDFIIKDEAFTSEIVVEGDRIRATEEGFTSVDFNPLDTDNTVIKKHADGVVSIITQLDGRSTVLAVFPDEKVKKSYADFTGVKVYKNLKVKIGEDLILLPEAHFTTLDYFERRDLNLKEKKDIKALENKLEEQFRNEVYPVYSSLRYKDLETASKFKNIDSYDSFIFYGENDYLDFTEEENKLFKDLLILDKKYKESAKELNNKIKTISKTTGFNAIDVKVGNGVKGDVEVIISDVDLLNNITPQAKNAALKKRGQETNKNVFALPLIEYTAEGYKYNFNKNLESGLRKLIEQASLNPSKIYTLDLYGSLEDSFIGTVTNEKVWRSISHVLHRIKPATWPRNFVVNGPGATFINQEKGGFFRAGINRTVPYSVVGDISDVNAFDVSYLSRNLEFKNGDTIDERYKKSQDLSLKETWYNWATENREDFENLARRIGTKSLYDNQIVLEARSKFFGSKPGTANQISTAKILVDLLNENFISNDWIYYQKQIYQPEVKFEGLLENQYRLPISAEYRSKLNLESSGKIILNIDGKDFIATEVDYSEGSLGFNESNLLEPMGITSEINANKFILDNYGIKATDKYFILSLTPFSGKRPTANKVKKGTFGKLLKEAVSAGKLEVGDEFIELADQATYSMVLDLSSRLASKNSDSPVYSNQRLEDIKNVVGGRLALGFDSSDAVHISGTTLEDNISEPRLVNAFKLEVEPLLKKLILADADILVGNNTGLDELIKLYLLNNSLGDYVETSKGLYQSSYKVKKEKTFKNENRIKAYSNKNKKRFESFSITREFNNPQAATFSAEVKPGLYSYEIDLDPADMANWNSPVDSKLISDLISSFNLTENENSLFSNTLRGDLITEEQRYISRYIGAVSLIKTDKQKTFNTTEEFDSYISDLRSTDESFNQKYLELSNKVFDSSFRFKNVSDVAALAMARSRDITNAYLSEIFMEEAISTDKNAYSALLSTARKEYENTREYISMLNDDTLTKSTFDLIVSSKDATLKDVYNLFITLGENKTYRNGKLSGELINKKLANIGVVAIKSDKSITLLDQDLLISLNEKTPGATIFKDPFEADSLTPKTSAGHKVEDMLMRVNPKLMKSLQKNGMIKIDYLTGNITVNIGEEVFYYNVDLQKADVVSFTNIFNNIKQNMIVDMFNDIDIELDIEDVKENTKNNRAFIGLASFYNVPVEKTLFKETENVLPEEIYAVKAGQNYNIEENGVITNTLFAFKRKGSINFLDKAGSLYRIEENKLLKSEEVAQLEGAKDNEIYATPALDSEATRLRLIDNTTERGYITVSESKGIVKAVNSLDGKEYIWVSEARAWSPVEGSVESELNLDLSAETEIIPGQKIMSIRLNGNLVVDLNNGIAVSKDVIEDTRNRFNRDSETGLWNLEAPTAIRGFKNTDIRYQKAKVSYVDSANKELASKSVSPVLLNKLVEKLSKTLNSPINSVSNLDIEFDDRFAGNKNIMNSPGFIYDGEVFINTDKATLDTPMHELLGHVFLSNLKSNNKALFDNIIKESLKEEKAVDKVLAKYPEYQNSPEDLGEEVFSSIIGVKLQEMAEDYLNKEESNLNFWEKIAKFMRDFFTNNLGPVFGFTKQIKPTDSLDTIINKLGEDVFKNEGTIFKELTNTKNSDLMTILNPNLTQEEIEDKFKSYGWIKEICR